MKTVIMGAGVTGVTAAYVLASRGHDVHVVEAESQAAMVTSYSNGAQLSYSHAEPWANPGVFKQVAKWMFRSDAPLVLRPKADVAMIKWMMQFMGNCTAAKTRENCERMMRIGLYSKEKMKVIMDDTKVKFDYHDGGILHVFSNRQTFDSAITQANFQETLGCREHVLTREETITREPALASSRKDIIGGIYSDIDASGDIHMFTQALADYCKKNLGVTFSYDTNILSINMANNNVTSITTSAGKMDAENYVMCLGAFSVQLLNPVGIKLPIYPMKGYSITMDAWDGAPTISVTDDEKKVVFTRIGDRIRSAGTAEFDGYDTTVKEARIEQMLGALRELFPDANVDNLEKWACVRPQTPDGPPLVGRSTAPNLFLNTGHGTLGWTQAAGTAYMLADVMEKRSTEIALSGFEMSRYRR